MKNKRENIENKDNLINPFNKFGAFSFVENESVNLRKKLKILFKLNLRTITQKTLMSVLSSRSQGNGDVSFGDRGLYMKRHIIDSIHNTHISVIVLSHVTPYKIKKKFVF